MMWPGDILAASVVALLLIAASTDIAYRLIPNWIAVIIGSLGMAGRLVVSPTAFCVSLAITLVLLALMLVLHARGLFGGGDVKLVSAVCLGLSASLVYRFIFITAMAGGVLALVHLIGRRAVRGRAVRGPLPRGSLLLHRIVSVEIWRLAHHGSLPYGVAIACGGIWTILVGPGN